MKKLFAGIILCLAPVGVVLAQQQQQQPPPQRIEPGLPNMEVVTFANLVSSYLKTNGQKAPENWSQIWDAGQIAHVGISSLGQPLVYRKIAFVNEAPRASADPNAPRILAVIRGPAERPWKDKDGNPFLQRAVIAITPQNKIRVSFIGSDKLFWKTDLNKLALKDPDPSPKQLADTIKAMFDMGFNSDQIYAALGNDDIESVKKSGALDSAFQRMLDEKPPQLASTPTLAASTSRPSATATPTVASEKSSSNFPIVPVVILAAVIAGAAVFFFRRKQP